MIEREKLETAVNSLASVMAGFPRDPLGREIVALELDGLVNSEAELLWLVGTIIRNVKRWPGIAEMRALFCTQYTPADGQYPASGCEIPGFTAEDIEAKGKRREMEENDRRLEGYRSARLLAPPEDLAPIELPISQVKAVPQLPPAKPRLCRHCKIESHPETFINDFCPRCLEYSAPMNLREREEALGIRPKPDSPPEAVN